MVATNSVAPGTANVSAGTSTFAMVMLEQELSGVHKERHCPWNLRLWDTLNRAGAAKRR